jgi:hypothetical protein
MLVPLLLQREGVSSFFCVAGELLARKSERIVCNTAHMARDTMIMHLDPHGHQQTLNVPSTLRWRSWPSCMATASARCCRVFLWLQVT